MDKRIQKSIQWAIDNLSVDQNTICILDEVNGLWICSIMINSDRRTTALLLAQQNTHYVLSKTAEEELLRYLLKRSEA